MTEPTDRTGAVDATAPGIGDDGNDFRTRTFDDADLEFEDDSETEAPDEPEDALPWLFRSARNFAWVLVLLGAVGLTASFSLTLEYLHKLQAPEEALLCDINPFITCGPAMQSWAGSVLGFPNIIIGLVAFTITITMGMGIFAGAKYARWFWAVYQIGLIGGAVLIGFLQWFSVFELARLCLWCMIIWTATIPLVALTTIFNLVHGHLGQGLVRIGRRLAPFAATVVILWYLVVLGVIFGGMWQVISLSLL